MPFVGWALAHAPVAPDGMSPGGSQGGLRPMFVGWALAHAEAIFVRRQRVCRHGSIIDKQGALPCLGSSVGAKGLDWADEVKVARRGCGEAS